MHAAMTPGFQASIHPPAYRRGGTLDPTRGGTLWVTANKTLQVRTAVKANQAAKTAFESTK